MSTSTDELRAAGRLTGEVLAAGVGLVAGVHEAITQRVAQQLPPPGRHIALLQGAIANAIYTGVAGAKRSGAVGAGEVLALTNKPDAAPLSDSKYGRVVLPAINGIWGDSVQDREPALAVRTAVRVAGRDLALTPGEVAQAFPSATGQLVVFLHGLSESDESWQRAKSGHPSYGARLAGHGLTPVYLRYNTGLRISDNGQACARLLQDLVAAWPVAVDRIVLVGHSMGGLVARGACHYAQRHGEAWVDHVDTVVALGSPHLGAPLEKAVHVTDWVLRQFPETAPFARLLRMRSVGVKDLGHGRIVEEDWRDHDPDEFLQDRCTEVPFLPHATYYFVAASITRDLRHPAGQLLGDGMVRYRSASGAGRNRRIGFAIDNGIHLGGVGHLALLNHPAVYQQLERWVVRRAVTAG